MRRSLYLSSSSTNLIRDITIIGGGPVGSSIAYHLAKDLQSSSSSSSSSATKPRIVVIERDNSYRSASAMLSAGGIRQQFSVPENVKMSIYGAKFLKSIPTLLR